MAVALCATAPLVYGAGAQARPARRGPKIIDQAPTDHDIAIPKAKLAQYYKEMDAEKIATLRMIEGGKFNVNIRRVKEAEARPLIHPKTIDLWVVQEGSGTIITGGTFANGQVTGGVTHQLKPGDVMFIPANLPHWMAKVGPTGVTWLNIRWDVDWPASAKMGAGNPPPAPGAPAPRLKPVTYASHEAVYIPKEQLAAYYKQMDADKIATLRMIEGGHFNINIRRVKEPEGLPLIHPTTIDLWVVEEGQGEIISGGTFADGKVTGGMTNQLRPGDVQFTPSNLNHWMHAVGPTASPG